jgi:hypothetical protein
MDWSFTKKSRNTAGRSCCCSPSTSTQLVVEGATVSRHASSSILPVSCAEIPLVEEPLTHKRDVFADVTSGTRAAIERPGVKKLLEYAGEGDMVVVWRVDRLGRSLVDVLKTVNMLRGRGILVRSLSNGIDPVTSTGRLMLNTRGGRGRLTIQRWLLPPLLGGEDRKFVIRSRRLCLVRSWSGTSTVVIVAGSALALLAGVLVAVLQLNGTMDDPTHVGCDLAMRRVGCS